MLFMLDEVMTPREASDRWGIKPSTLRKKLERSDKVDTLIQEGKLKYYKPDDKQRGEWILTIEAMNVLYPKE